MPEKGLFSGNFAVPVGALDLLGKEDENSLDPSDSIVQHITDPNIDVEGTGGGVIWVRASAAGTIIKQSGDVSTVVRDSEGVYTVTLTNAIASENYGVVITPSAEAGNGGDGTVKFQAYDSHLVEDVGDDGFGLYKASTNYAYVTERIAADQLWIHDLTNFSTDPTTTAMPAYQTVQVISHFTR